MVEAAKSNERRLRQISEESQRFLGFGKTTMIVAEEDRPLELRTSSEGLEQDDELDSSPFDVHKPTPHGR